MHANFQSLLDSSESCYMCGLVRYRLHNVIKQVMQLGLKGDSRLQEIYLTPHAVPGKVWIRALGLKLNELWLYAHSGKPSLLDIFVI